MGVDGTWRTGHYDFLQGRLASAMGNASAEVQRRLLGKPPVRHVTLLLAPRKPLEPRLTPPAPPSPSPFLAKPSGPVILPQVLDPKKPPRLPPDPIMGVLVACAWAWGLSLERLLSKHRSNRECFPRFAAMLILRDEPYKRSQSQIKRILNKRDHTAIWWGQQRAMELEAGNPDWARRLRLAKRLLAT